MLLHKIIFQHNYSPLNIKINGTERIRTVIVFIDSEVHQPFCHSPIKFFEFEIQSKIGWIDENRTRIFRSHRTMLCRLSYNPQKHLSFNICQ